MLRASWRDCLWVVVCAALSSLWCVTAAQQLSATFDETLYLKVGLERWRTGSFRQLKRMGTMPLPVDVCTLPLYLAERATGLPIDLDTEMPHWLPVARTAALVFWVLLLVYAWRTANLLAGPWAGRWAVALLAVEPNFLGHAGLATTDVASAACLLALAFHYRTARERGAWIAPVFWFTATLLAKASAIVYGPICMLVAEIDYRVSTGLFSAWPLSWRRVARPLFWSGLRIGGIVFLGLILASLYCGRNTGPGTQGIPHWVPLYTQTVEAIVTQVRHNHKGHGGTYLFGSWSENPLWYYFPAVLSIKLPLPLLVLPILIVLARWRSLANWPLAAAGVILLASLTCRIQIGIRYLLPGLALAIVGLAVAGVCAWRRQSLPWAQRGFALLAVVALLATTIGTARTWPHCLSYTNGLWASPEDGYRLLSDSNYDWGQGLYELAAWQRESDSGPLEVAYFGTDPTLTRLNMRSVALPDLSLERPGPPHRLAVSTTVLFGHYHSQCETARRLRTLTPAARTTTFLIYDLPRVSVAKSVDTEPGE